MQGLSIFGLLAATYLLVLATRMPALVRYFRYQSFFLFLATLGLAREEQQVSLYVVAGLVFIIKVIAIPFFLQLTMEKIKVRDDLGLIINVQISLLLALVFTGISWLFSKQLVEPYSIALAIIPAVAFFVTLTGMFLMICRLTALAQIVGLLVMENGIFLLAAAVLGGMPFFVEIAIFFDVFVSVLIMGFFVYRINKLFTHIDVNKLSRLRG